MQVKIKLFLTSLLFLVTVMYNIKNKNCTSMTYNEFAIFFRIRVEKRSD
jgi:hypothetical protein